MGQTLRIGTDFSDFPAKIGRTRPLISGADGNAVFHKSPQLASRSDGESERLGQRKRPRVMGYMTRGRSGVEGLDCSAHGVSQLTISSV